MKRYPKPTPQEELIAEALWNEKYKTGFKRIRRWIREDYYVSARAVITALVKANIQLVETI